MASGRVVASSVSSASGQYRIAGLRAGVYRVFAQPLEGPVTATDIGASGRTTGSLRETVFEVTYPVIAFEATVDGRIQPGDFTIRLQSRSGELAFLPGALTIEGP